MTRVFSLTFTHQAVYVQRKRKLSAGVVRQNILEVVKTLTLVAVAIAGG